jgi:uncharacterized membrane protein YuzA (DUF378 family)
VGLTVIVNMNMTSKVLVYSAAASTLISGVLHVALVPMFVGQMTPEVTVFFVASGLAQIFWILPTVKRWIMPWYYIGIGGTIVLIVLWIVFIPGGGHPIDLNSAVIEAFQIAFVILSVIIIKKSREETIKSGM